MRDLMSDLEAGRHRSDPDPVRRAQDQMRKPLPKRFYERADIAQSADGPYEVHLDGRAARTPGRAVLAFPTEAAARLLADEFTRQKDEIDPTDMPVYRIANTAIDGVARDPQAVIEDIMRFASSDMICYRADAPQPLVDRQSDAWDPVLDWARSRLGARFYLAEGVMHVEQPRESIGAVGIHLGQRPDPLRLACLHVMTTLTGSALLALALEDGEVDAQAAWAAAHVDEDWNVAQWGEDDEAAARRALRWREMDAATRLVKALG